MNVFLRSFSVEQPLAIENTDADSQTVFLDCTLSKSSAVFVVYFDKHTELREFNKDR